VALVTADAEAAGRWRHWLEQERLAVVVVPPEGPLPLPCDVVLVDGRQAETATAISPGHNAAVVFIGPADAVLPAADAVLPAEFHARELRLACRLLAELAQRRRPPAPDALASETARKGSGADRDELTSLAGRAAWRRELEARLATAAAGGPPVAVALFDLDYFKQVNDGWGLAAGDAVLCAAAEALRACLRQGFVARLGGDEFGVMLGGLTVADAGAVVERVRAQMPAAMAVRVPHVVGASAGVTVAAAGASSAKDLYAAAAEALLQAKQGGRGRTVVYADDRPAGDRPTGGAEEGGRAR
jgi:diguanylate cyclase (GGDEF)-like protein